jgi:hypothetical protein
MLTTIPFLMTPAMFILAAASTALALNPTNLTIYSIAYGGTGCPQGSFKGVISQNSSRSLFFLPSPTQLSNIPQFHIQL